MNLNIDLVCAKCGEKLICYPDCDGSGKIMVSPCGKCDMGKADNHVSDGTNFIKRWDIWAYSSGGDKRISLGGAWDEQEAKDMIRRWATEPTVKEWLCSCMGFSEPISLDINLHLVDIPKHIAREVLNAS
jgi:hypothetical protein